MADQIISTWDRSPLRPLIPLQDERNAEVLQSIIDRPIREASKQLAAAREVYASRLLEDCLPKRLRWVIDRPRALKFVLRLVPRWRPTFTVVDLRRESIDPMEGMIADEACYFARAWVAEAKATGKNIPESGLIFTYTDMNGMPAELSGTAWPTCGARTIRWPDDEACEAECMLPADHSPTEVHFDEILGEWSESDELPTTEAASVLPR
jgi:hypothetical protein